MRRRGLEPPPGYPGPGPQPGASTNSAIGAGRRSIDARRGLLRRRSGRSRPPGRPRSRAAGTPAVRSCWGAVKIWSGGPCSRITPSDMKQTRSAIWRAKPISCVERIIVIPDCRQLADDGEHLADQLRVERAGDLVEQHQLRLHRQRAHDRGALLLAARQPVRVLAGLVAEPEAVEQLARALLARRPRSASAPCAAPASRSPARSCAGTGCRPGRRSRSRGGSRSMSTFGRRDLLAGEHDPAVGDRLDQVRALQQRRLAAARRPDQADDLVRLRPRDRRRAGPRPRRRSCAPPRAASSGSVALILPTLACASGRARSASPWRVRAGS